MNLSCSLWAANAYFAGECAMFCGIGVAFVLVGIAAVIAARRWKGK